MNFADHVMLVVGCVPLTVYLILSIVRGTFWLDTRHRDRRLLHRPHGASFTLRELSALVHGWEPFEPPFALLAPSEVTELHELRGCGYTWDELEGYAPSWGMNPRAVAAERRRIEEGLR